jgi:hypothetical protein
MRTYETQAYLSLVRPAAPEACPHLSRVSQEAAQEEEAMTARERADKLVDAIFGWEREHEELGLSRVSRKIIAVPIAAAIEAAVAEEREACAAIAEKQEMGPQTIARDIRARGNP